MVTAMDLRRHPAAAAPPGAGRGYAYLMLLVAVAVMGVSLAAVGEVWWTAKRRESEQQLLFIGAEFRRALISYSAQDAVDRYPRRLQDLLLDPRYPDVRRHLRRIYADPITGTAQWGVLKGVGGEIYGVYSLSDEAPIKRAGFAPEFSHCEGKSKYSEWLFALTPPVIAADTTAGRRPPPQP